MRVGASAAIAAPRLALTLPVTTFAHSGWTDTIGAPISGNSVTIAAPFPGLAVYASLPFGDRVHVGLGLFSSFSDWGE